MVGIVIGVATAVPTAAAVIFISFAKLNDAMQKRSATWRKFFDGFNDEDAKKPQRAQPQGLKILSTIIFTHPLYQIGWESERWKRNEKICIGGN